MTAVGVLTGCRANTGWRQLLRVAQSRDCGGRLARFRASYRVETHRRIGRRVQAAWPLASAGEPLAFLCPNGQVILLRAPAAVGRWPKSTVRRPISAPLLNQLRKKTIEAREGLPSCLCPRRP